MDGELREGGAERGSRPESVSHGVWVQQPLLRAAWWLIDTQANLFCARRHPNNDILPANVLSALRNVHACTRVNTIWLTPPSTPAV